MYAKWERGEISKAELMEWVEGVDYSSLPEQAAQKRKGKRGRKA